jgi:hypothetical protein
MDRAQGCYNAGFEWRQGNKMIDWQHPNTAPKDTSFFVVETILGDIQAWTFDRDRNWFEILHIPGGGRTIAYTNSTIKRWARWNQVFDLIRSTPSRT